MDKQHVLLYGKMRFGMWKGKQFLRNGKSYFDITEFTFH